MKNIFKLSYIALLSLGLTFSSCDDELDIPPNSSLIAETAFNNVEDLQRGLNAAYASYNANIVLELNSIFTDNTNRGVDNGGQEIPLLSLIMNATTGEAATMWISRYQQINRATRVIEAEKIIDYDDNDQENVNYILGQAYALRAFGHFELFQYFTPDYLNGDGLSVPAVDFIVQTQNLPRNTVSEVLNLINSDLNQASQLIDDNDGDISFITEDFIKALRTRIALFTADYDTAKDLADDLIDDYQLADQEDYLEMFKSDGDVSEVIWQAVRLQGDARPGFIWNFTGGGPFIEMSNELYGLYGDDDIRKEAVLLENASDVDAGVLVIGKYPGASQEFLNNVKVFRVSEMYLISAEAAARAGDLDEAEDLVQELRNARLGDDDADDVDYDNLDEALDGILLERRLELSFEGHRYLDLKRLGVPLERDLDDCGDLSNACGFPVSDRRFTLPIPLVELNANNVITQNPGY